MYIYLYHIWNTLVLHIGDECVSIYCGFWKWINRTKKGLEATSEQCVKILEQDSYVVSSDIVVSVNWQKYRLFKEGINNCCQCGSILNIIIGPVSSIFQFFVIDTNLDLFFNFYRGININFTSLFSWRISYKADYKHKTL